MHAIDPEYELDRRYNQFIDAVRNTIEDVQRPPAADGSVKFVDSLVTFRCISDRYVLHFSLWKICLVKFRQVSFSVVKFHFDAYKILLVVYILFIYYLKKIEFSKKILFVVTARNRSI